LLDRRGKNNEDGSFNWADAIIDATIVAGLSFFTTLGGLGATGLLTDPTKGLLAAFIGAATNFFSFLAMKRGLREPLENE